MKLLVDRVKPGDRVVDVGAGNGRLADVLPPGVEYLGVEPSSALRAAAKHNVVAGSLPHLDLPDGHADTVACIAVLHHIPSDEGRRAAVAELRRILKPGGTLLLTVWNLRARRFLSWLTFKHAWLRLAGVAGGETGDLMYPWRAAGQNENRYVHALTLGELKSLLDAKDWEVESIGAYDNGAWRSVLNGRNLVVLARRR